MSRVNNKEKYKEYDHKYYIKNKRPKTKIGQAELKIAELEAKLADTREECSQLFSDNVRASEEIAELKQQLTEKEKEFEWLHQKFAKETNAKAIEELEKVRKYVDGRTYLAQYIDERVNQIKDGN